MKILPKLTIVPIVSRGTSAKDVMSGIAITLHIHGKPKLTQLYGDANQRLC